MQNMTKSGKMWNVNNPHHCHLVDMYGQKCLPKNLGITLIFHPSKEKKALSATKTKFWAVEIMPFWGSFEGRVTFQALTPKPHKLRTWCWYFLKASDYTTSDQEQKFFGCCGNTVSNSRHQS